MLRNLYVTGPNVQNKIQKVTPAYLLTEAGAVVLVLGYRVLCVRVILV